MLPRTLTAGFIPPCLPSKATEPPTGAAWLHEIKHDGFRIIARKDGSRVRLYSRPGNDFTGRFPLIVEALAWLGARSCIIDGEAVACGGDGVPSFDRIRYRRHDASVFLYAFDLIALDGGDLRREPLEVRKATLASVLAKAARGLRFGGVPASHRPDNAKVAVIKACLYEPQVNRSYAEMAAHRGFLSASALIYRRLPSANDKCPLNSFLDVRNKLLVA